ncbi:MAG TPA: hypothetical protein K8V64_00580 [Enterococcus durans]|nr:hypothetical protein [Enterococcus sp. VV15]HJG21563.1 hypothetical protein [Enterococcus durans]
MGQKCLTSRNKKKLTKIVFQIFVDFGLFIGVASAPIVYSFLKNETKVFLTFVPRSFIRIIVISKVTITKTNQNFTKR